MVFWIVHRSAVGQPFKRSDLRRLVAWRIQLRLSSVLDRRGKHCRGDTQRFIPQSVCVDQRRFIYRLHRHTLFRVALRSIGQRSEGAKAKRDHGSGEALNPEGIRGRPMAGIQLRKLSANRASTLQASRSAIVLVGAQRITRSRAHYSVDGTAVVSGTSQLLLETDNV